MAYKDLHGMGTAYLSNVVFLYASPTYLYYAHSQWPLFLFFLTRKFLFYKGFCTRCSSCSEYFLCRASHGYLFLIIQVLFKCLLGMAFSDLFQSLSNYHFVFLSIII